MKSIDKLGRPTDEAMWPLAETRAARGRLERRVTEEGTLPPPPTACERYAGGALPLVVSRQEALAVLDEYQKHAWQTGVLFSVLFVDVDALNNYNHRFGQEAGDELLTRLGDLLRASVRRSDLVARWGGDEFLVGLRGANLETAEVVAERLRLNPALMDAPLGPFTVSIGVAAWRSDLADTQHLVAEAQMGLHNAKKCGGNCVRRASTYEPAYLKHLHASPST
ncbi:MAG: GGDEF domain-containing protein [Fimbriimonadia bacterium]|jgi:diguanylate cyclase (GGDEF)-like protein